MFEDEKVKIVNIDLPSPCNLNCDFCYLPKRDGTLTISRIEEIINEFPNAQIFNIGGGEPFFDDWLIGIIEHIERLKDKRIVIATNATHIPEEIIGLPYGTRNRMYMQVNLPAGGSELYKDVTGKDEFDNVLNNIKRLKNHYHTTINMVVYQKNYESIDEVLKIAQGFEMPARINLAIPIGKGKNIEILNEKQLKKLRDYLLVKKASGSAIQSPLLDVDKDNCSLNRCVAVEQFYNIKKEALCPVDLGMKAYIDTDGNRFECEYLASEDYINKNTLVGVENG